MKIMMQGKRTACMDKDRVQEIRDNESLSSEEERARRKRVRRKRVRRFRLVTSPVYTWRCQRHPTLPSQVTTETMRDGLHFRDQSSASSAPVVTINSADHSWHTRLPKYGQYSVSVG